LDRLPLRRQRLSALGRRLQAALARRLEQQHGRLSTLSGRLDALSPLKVLERGYALVTVEKAGTIVRDPAQVRPGDTLRVQVSRGELFARVLEPDHDGC
jgi:exodeoxyribonuclease VII large subunit